MKDQPLKGRCAIVTGASRGIGRAIALTLVREGAGVVIFARGQSKVKDGGSLFSLESEIKSSGGSAVAVQGDVTREEDVRALVEAAMEKFGRIDILVNNAAPYQRNYDAPLYEYPVDAWDENMAVILRGTFLCIRAVVPKMVERKHGSIINLSSLAAVRSAKGRVAYGVAKAGLERLTFGLAEEVKEYNIAVNALCPLSFTDTESVRDLFHGESDDRWVKPEDVAEAAVWLARQDASTFTGKAITVPAHAYRTFFVYGRGSGEKPWGQID